MGMQWSCMDLRFFNYEWRPLIWSHWRGEIYVPSGPISMWPTSQIGYRPRMHSISESGEDDNGSSNIPHSIKVAARRKHHRIRQFCNLVNMDLKQGTLSGFLRHTGTNHSKFKLKDYSETEMLHNNEICTKVWRLLQANIAWTKSSSKFIQKHYSYYIGALVTGEIYDLEFYMQKKHVKIQSTWIKLSDDVLDNHLMKYDIFFTTWNFVCCERRVLFGRLYIS